MIRSFIAKRYHVILGIIVVTAFVAAFARAYHFEVLGTSLVFFGGMHAGVILLREHDEGDE